jgi:hypothetical protein
MVEFRKEGKKRNTQRIINRVHYLLTHHMNAREGPLVVSDDATLDNTAAQQQQLLRTRLAPTRISCKELERWNGIG